MKLFYKFFLVLLSINLASANELTSQNHADEPTQIDKTYMNSLFGFSPFTGIIGLELINGHNSFGIGLPGHISYRYLFNKNTDTFFVGAFAGQNTYDDYNEREGGIKFKEKESEYIGVGFGKRWYWKSGWNFSLIAAIQRYDYTYSNPNSSLKVKEEGYEVMPGFIGGYKF